MKSLLFFLPLFFTFFQHTSFNELNTDGPGPGPVNKQLLLQMVNDVRKKGCKCGDTYYPAAPILAWNSQLEKAALVHSNDM
ncbi:MAG: CAP domain-containing protein, partial [Bacteroidota bacterium]|nr:CAP domain-containing protein [Bacteroidota bacterium]